MPNSFNPSTQHAILRRACAIHPCIIPGGCVPPFKLKDNLDVQVSKPYHVRPPLVTQNMQHCVNCSGDRGKHVFFFNSMHVVSTHVCIVHGYLSLLPSLRGLPGHRAATVYNKPAANKVGTGPFQERTREYRNEGNAQLDGLANKLWDKTLAEGPTMKTAVTEGYFPINPLLLYRAFHV